MLQDLASLTPVKGLLQLFWILPLVVYGATMARTVGYVDAALVLNNAYFLEIHAWVNNHNLFSILGWLWIRLLPEAPGRAPGISGRASSAEHNRPGPPFTCFMSSIEIKKGQH